MHGREQREHQLNPNHRTRHEKHKADIKDIKNEKGCTIRHIPFCIVSSYRG